MEYMSVVHRAQWIHNVLARHKSLVFSIDMCKTSGVGVLCKNLYFNRHYIVLDIIFLKHSLEFNLHELVIIFV